MEKKVNRLYYEKAGLLVPDVLLPAAGTDLCKWAVIACDQFTSSPDYWEDLRNVIGGAPSALDLILPEKYLGSGDFEDRISAINGKMREYISGGVFGDPVTGLILVKRTLPSGSVRTGVIAALDLEKYDYVRNDRLVRATEGTVLSRIPPRVAIRKNAPLELPHILVLINDPQKTAVEYIASKAAELKPLYDTVLNSGGGSVKGWLADDPGLLDRFARRLSALATEEDGKSFLYAVGDGNHSFAAAKDHWEKLKKEGADEFHPARFVLCELENIHDDGIIFEPIHRVLFDTGIEDFTDSFTAYFGLSASASEITGCDPAESLDALNRSDGEDYVKAVVFSKDRRYMLYVDRQVSGLSVAAVQRFLDDIYPDKRTDYIHGEAELEAIVDANDALGILLPRPPKDCVFTTISKGGILPRKTFSMGDAETKRYYMEARKITE